MIALMCGHCPTRVLAVLLPGGRWEVKHQGRVIRGAGSFEEDCDRCGRTTSYAIEGEALVGVSALVPA